jgi:hypothetical protein
MNVHMCRKEIANQTDRLLIVFLNQCAPAVSIHMHVCTINNSSQDVVITFWPFFCYLISLCQCFLVKFFLPQY